MTKSVLGVLLFAAILIIGSAYWIWKSWKKLKTEKPKPLVDLIFVAAGGEPSGPHFMLPGLALLFGLYLFFSTILDLI